MKRKDGSASKISKNKWLLSKNKWLLEQAESKKIPVFVVTPEFLMSIELLRHYRHLCKITRHSDFYLEEIDKTIAKFIKWQLRNKKKIKTR